MVIGKIQTTEALLGLLFLLLLASCSNETPADPPGESPPTLAAIEENLRTELDALTTDADFTLLVKTFSGRSFSHSTGESTESTLYKSASTCKLVTAVMILTLVEEGSLNLNSHPQDFIENWPQEGNLAAIELRHLLNFTSGLNEDPFCTNLGFHDFEDCIDEIAALNIEAGVPGEEFYYAGAHLQVAGLMAVVAGAYNDWQEFFTAFQGSTELFSGAAYDLPSLQNPRLAGGMHWSADEYVEFLEALYKGQILSPEMVDQMTQDQIGAAEIGYSPSVFALNEDWHYGFGNWIECHSSQFNCSETTRISSQGAYGAYPFIDFEHGYFGVLARQGALNTYDQGYAIFEANSGRLQEWAVFEVED